MSRSNQPWGGFRRSSDDDDADSIVSSFSSGGASASTDAPSPNNNAALSGDLMEGGNATARPSRGGGISGQGALGSSFPEQQNATPHSFGTSAKDYSRRGLVLGDPDVLGGGGVGGIGGLFGSTPPVGTAVTAGNLPANPIPSTNANTNGSAAAPFDSSNLLLNPIALSSPSTAPPPNASSPAGAAVSGVRGGGGGDVGGLDVSTLGMSAFDVAAPFTSASIAAAQPLSISSPASNPNAATSVGSNMGGGSGDRGGGDRGDRPPSLFAAMATGGGGGGGSHRSASPPSTISPSTPVPVSAPATVNASPADAPPPPPPVTEPPASVSLPPAVAMGATGGSFVLTSPMLGAPSPISLTSAPTNAVGPSSAPPTGAPSFAPPASQVSAAGAGSRGRPPITPQSAMYYQQQQQWQQQQQDEKDERARRRQEKQERKEEKKERRRAAKSNSSTVGGRRSSADDMTGYDSAPNSPSAGGGGVRRRGVSFPYGGQGDAVSVSGGARNYAGSAFGAGGGNRGAPASNSNSGGYGPRSRSIQWDAGSPAHYYGGATSNAGGSRVGGGGGNNFSSGASQSPSMGLGGGIQQYRGGPLSSVNTPRQRRSSIANAANMVTIEASGSGGLGGGGGVFGASSHLNSIPLSGGGTTAHYQPGALNSPTSNAMAGLFGTSMNGGGGGQGFHHSRVGSGGASISGGISGYRRGGSVMGGVDPLDAPRSGHNTPTRRGAPDLFPIGAGGSVSSPSQQHLSSGAHHHTSSVGGPSSQGGASPNKNSSSAHHVHLPPPTVLSSGGGTSAGGGSGTHQSSSQQYISKHRAEITPATVTSAASAAIASDEAKAREEERKEATSTARRAAGHYATSFAHGVVNLFQVADEEEDIMERRGRDAGRQYSDGYHLIPWDQRATIPLDDDNNSQCSCWISPRFWERIDWAVRCTGICVVPASILTLVGGEVNGRPFVLPGCTIVMALWVSQPTLGRGLRELYLALKGGVPAFALCILMVLIRPYNQWYWLGLFCAAVFIIALLSDEIKKPCCFFIACGFTMYYERRHDIDYVTMVEFYVDILIGLSMGCCSFFIWRINWALTRAKNHVVVLGNTAAVSIAGICSSFWTDSRLDRELNLVRIRQLKHTSARAFAVIEVQLFDACYEPHRSLTMAKVRARRDLLRQVMGVINSASNFIEVIAENPQWIATDSCTQMGQLLGADMAMFGAAMDSYLLRICDFDKPVRLVREGVPLPSGGGAAGVDPNQPPSVVLPGIDKSAFMAAKDKFTQSLELARQQVMLENPNFKPSQSDIMLGFFLCSIEQLAEILLKFEEPQQVAVSSTVRRILMSPWNEVKDTYTKLRTSVLMLCRGIIPRDVKESVKLAIAMGVSCLIEIATDTLDPMSGAAIIPWVYAHDGQGTYNLMLMRVLGTVVGSIVAFMGAELVDQNVVGVILLIALFTLCGAFVQTSREFSPAGNAFIWGVVSIAAKFDIRDVAINRFTANVIGVLVYFIVSFVIWPNRMSSNIKEHLQRSLKAFRQATLLLVKGVDENPSRSRFEVVRAGPSDGQQQPQDALNNGGVAVASGAPMMAEERVRMGWRRGDGLGTDGCELMPIDGTHTSPTMGAARRPTGGGGGSGGVVRQPTNATVSTTDSEDEDGSGHLRQQQQLTTTDLSTNNLEAFRPSPLGPISSPPGGRGIPLGGSSAHIYAGVPQPIASNSYFFATDALPSAQLVLMDAHNELDEFGVCIAHQEASIPSCVKEPTLTTSDFPEEQWMKLVRCQKNLYHLLSLLRFSFETFARSHVIGDAESIHWSLLSAVREASVDVANMVYASIDLHLLMLEKVTNVPTHFLVRLRGALVARQIQMEELFLERLTDLLHGLDSGAVFVDNAAPFTIDGPPTLADGLGGGVGGGGGGLLGDNMSQDDSVRIGGLPTGGATSLPEPMLGLGFGTRGGGGAGIRPATANAPDAGGVSVSGWGDVSALGSGNASTSTHGPLDPASPHSPFGTSAAAAGGRKRGSGDDTTSPTAVPLTARHADGGSHFDPNDNDHTDAFAPPSDEGSDENTSPKAPPLRRPSLIVSVPALEGRRGSNGGSDDDDPLAGTHVNNSSNKSKSNGSSSGEGGGDDDTPNAPTNASSTARPAVGGDATITNVAREGSAVLDDTGSKPPSHFAQTLSPEGPDAPAVLVTAASRSSNSNTGGSPAASHAGSAGPPPLHPTPSSANLMRNGSAMLGSTLYTNGSFVSVGAAAPQQQTRLRMAGDGTTVITIEPAAPATGMASANNNTFAFANAASTTTPSQSPHAATASSAADAAMANATAAIIGPEAATADPAVGALAVKALNEARIVSMKEEKAKMAADPTAKRLAEEKKKAEAMALVSGSGGAAVDSATALARHAQLRQGREAWQLAQIQKERERQQRSTLAVVTNITGAASATSGGGPTPSVAASMGADTAPPAVTNATFINPPPLSGAATAFSNAVAASTNSGTGSAGVGITNSSIFPAMLSNQSFDPSASFYNRAALQSALLNVTALGLADRTNGTTAANNNNNNGTSPQSYIGNESFYNALGGGGGLLTNASFNGGAASVLGGTVRSGGAATGTSKGVGVGGGAGTGTIVADSIAATGRAPIVSAQAPIMMINEADVGKVINGGEVVMVGSGAFGNNNTMSNASFLTPQAGGGAFGASPHSHVSNHSMVGGVGAASTAGGGGAAGTIVVPNTMGGSKTTEMANTMRNQKQTVESSVYQLMAEQLGIEPGMLMRRLAEAKRILALGSGGGGGSVGTPSVVGVGVTAPSTATPTTLTGTTAMSSGLVSPADGNNVTTTAVNGSFIGPSLMSGGTASLPSPGAPTDATSTILVGGPTATGPLPAGASPANNVVPTDPITARLEALGDEAIAKAIKVLVLSNGAIHSIEAFIFGIHALIQELGELEKALLEMQHVEEINETL